MLSAGCGWLGLKSHFSLRPSHWRGPAHSRPSADSCWLCESLFQPFAVRSLTQGMKTATRKAKKCVKEEAFLVMDMEAGPTGILQI